MLSAARGLTLLLAAAAGLSPSSPAWSVEVTFTVEELLPDGSNLDSSGLLESSWNPAFDDVFAAGVDWLENPLNITNTASGQINDRNNSPGSENFSPGAIPMDVLFDADGDGLEDPLHEALEGIVFDTSSFTVTIDNLVPNSDYRIQLISWDAGVEGEFVDGIFPEVVERATNISASSLGTTGALNFSQFLLDGPDVGTVAGDSSDEIAPALVTASFTTAADQTSIEFALTPINGNTAGILNGVLVHNESLEAFDLEDINEDGFIDLLDAAILRDNLGNTVLPNEDGDLDGDQLVTLLDFRILTEALSPADAARLGLGVPEPSSLALLAGLASTALLTSRIRRGGREAVRTLGTVALAALLLGLGPEAVVAQQPTQRILSVNPPTATFPQAATFDIDADPDQPFNEGGIARATTVFNSALQVNPNALANQGRVMVLAAPEATGSVNSQGGATLEQYTFSNWQYIDRFVDFGGTFDGNILTPRSGWIDAAHRNGVKIYGNIFLPPEPFGGDSSQVFELVQQAPDGSFPVADNLIATAERQGFDGYFLNQEVNIPGAANAEQVGQFIDYIQANSSIEVIWYTSQAESGFVTFQEQIDSTNDRFFQNNGQVVSDAAFLDFGATVGNLETTRTNVNNLGRSEFDVYAGALLGANGIFEPSAQQLVQNAFEAPDGNHRTSVGLFGPDNAGFNAAQAQGGFDIQALINEDSQIFVGANGDPSNTTNPVPGTTWQGIANYVAANTPLTSDTFVTNFNFGLGTQYAIEGEVSAVGEWNNIGLQDVLPTWRWIVDTDDATPVEVSFDFDRAFHGGNSLRIEGSLDAETDIPLYLASVPVHDDSQLTLAFKTGQIGDSQAQVIVRFEGDEANAVAIPLGATDSEGWNRFSADLSAFNGQTIASLGLRFADADDSDFMFNLGRLGVIRGEAEAPAPATNAVAQGVEILNGETADVRLLWDHSVDYSRDADNEIYNYNVFRLEQDGSRTFLGGASTNAFFIDNLERDGTELTTQVEVEAVSNEFGVSTAEEFLVRWETTAVITIDRQTGEVVIANALADSVSISDYTIEAPGGTLNPAEWQSLTDQGVTGFQQDSATSGALSESSATALLTASDTSVSLGQAFTPRELAFGVDDENVTFEYTEDGQVIEGNVLFVGESTNNLTITIDPLTGAATIENTSTFAAEIDGYQILSEAGSLTPETWLSFADQGISGFEEANPSANQLAELNFIDTLVLESGDTLDLGQIFTPGATQDLTFEFALVGGATITLEGILNFSAALPGDYNNDGVVNALDYVVFRDNFGAPAGTLPNDIDGGVIGAAQFQTFVDNFGATAPTAATTAGQVVPEPSTITYLAAIAAPQLIRRRKRSSNTSPERPLAFPRFMNQSL